MSHYDPSQPSQSQGPRPDAPIQSGWQQPSSQPQPSAKQAPRLSIKKVPGKLTIVLGIIATLIAMYGLFISGHSNTAHPTKSAIISARPSQQATRVVMTPTLQPTLVIQAVGRPIVVDSTWTITVNGARISPGDAFSTPATGDVYLVIDVTVKNTSRYFQDMLSGNQFLLKDSAGQQYQEAITDFATPPDGYIKPGGSQRGQLAYEIPATMHTFAYYFQTDINGAHLIEWTLHV